MRYFILVDDADAPPVNARSAEEAIDLVQRTLHTAPGASYRILEICEENRFEPAGNRSLRRHGRS